jgi:hypothetical protein
VFLLAGVLGIGETDLGHRHLSFASINASGVNAVDLFRYSLRQEQQLLIAELNNKNIRRKQ